MSELAIYRDEQHAIVRAMAVDSIPSCGACTVTQNQKNSAWKAQNYTKRAIQA